MLLILEPGPANGERCNTWTVPEFPLSSRQRATSRLLAVGAFGLFGAGLSLTYRITGWGLPCPWRSVTGTLCPLCGATHAGSELLSGNVAAAWSDNPFVLSVGAIVAVLTVFWAVEALGGPAARLPGLLRRPGLWWGALFVAAAAFTVVRNL